MLLMLEVSAMVEACSLKHILAVSLSDLVPERMSRKRELRS